MSRFLDAALAESWGYEVKLKPHPVIILEGKRRRLPEYSKRGNYMLELIDEMRARGWHVWIDTLNGNYACEFYKRGFFGPKFHAPTMPEAVALAAYKALTGKEWIER